MGNNRNRSKQLGVMRLRLVEWATIFNLMGLPPMYPPNQLDQPIENICASLVAKRQQQANVKRPM